MSHKNVLITGASRGIGRAIALYFIEKNYNTILVCKGDISRMNDLKEKAEGNNLSCLCYSLDISEFSNIEEIASDLTFEKKTSASPSILVSNISVAAE